MVGRSCPEPPSTSKSAFSIPDECLKSDVPATMFKALGNAGINIGMISTSEIKIAVTVDETRIEDAPRAVHDAFQLDKAPA